MTGGSAITLQTTRHSYQREEGRHQDYDYPGGNDQPIGEHAAHDQPP